MCSIQGEKVLKDRALPIGIRGIRAENELKVWKRNFKSINEYLLEKWFPFKGQFTCPTNAVENCSSVRFKT
jgi:hypothetical protein